MRVLVIEDENLASQRLVRLLKAMDSKIEVAGVLRSCEATVNWLIENPAPELIFMDVQLEDGLCFDIFENYTVNIPVIFISAYDEYAIKAFKVNSVDYLLKPIDQKELKNALDKFYTIHKPKTNYANLETVIHQLHHQPKERFLIKIGEHYKSIPASRIYCFYISGRATFLFTDTARCYPVDYTLDNIEQLVDSKLFFRINRNFIINYYAIQDIIAYSSHRLKIILSNWTENEDIIVSRERVAGFKQWMNR